VCLSLDLLLALSFCLAVAVALEYSRPATLAMDGAIVGGSETVSLEPDAWLNRPFPLLDHINIGDRIRRGNWIVFLYHRDCQKCNAALGHYRQLAADLQGQEDAPRVALIEVPVKENAGAREEERAPCIQGWLNPGKRWLVRTPIALVIGEGYVLSKLDGVPSN
jgi:hypothetical protein